MCGIAGVIAGSLPAQEAEARVRSMLRALKHRGPDGEGTTSWNGGAIGMVRLALVDLSERGNQPMFSADRKVAIVFNGEMYNHVAERRRLSEKGYSFHSTSDTEVILALYLEAGLDFVNRIRGMYAIAIADFRGRPAGAPPKLVLARDPLGIKPLYVCEPDGPGKSLAFSSELRALVATRLSSRQVSPEGLADFLSFGFVLQPRTILRDVRMLPRGSVLVHDGQTASMQQRWRLPPATHRARSFEDSVRELRSVLEDSVRLHALADTDIGAFLSAGTDSSGVAALMAQHTRRLKTFTVSAEGMDDESAQAKAFANRLGCEHTEVVVTDEEVGAQFRRFASELDQPSTDGINTWLVSRAAGRSVKGVLSGLGGDEWFAGYPVVQRMAAVHANARLRVAGRLAGPLARWVPDRALAQRVANVGARANPLATWAQGHQIFPPYLLETTTGLRSADGLGTERLANALGPELSSTDPVDLSCELDVLAYMGCQLLRDSDVTSMASSLELRVPLVDVEVARFSRSCPPEHKLQPGPHARPKRVLVAALADLLPEDIAQRPKRGFSLPYERWLRGPLATLAEAAPRELARRGVDAPPITEAYPQRWALMILEQWWKALDSWGST